MILSCSDKLVFFVVIIEDDSGDTEPPEEKIPYQLTKEGMYLDMKVKTLMVRHNKQYSVVKLAYGIIWPLSEASKKALIYHCRLYIT